MVLRFLAMGVVAVGVLGCASPGITTGPGGGPPGYPPDAFAHRVATSHVVLYWNCHRPTGGVLSLDGVAQNPWTPQEVRFLELELVGVDGEERTVSRVRGAARDILIRTNQFSPFRLDLRMAGGEARFDLFYAYRFQDVEMEGRLAGPVAGGARLFAQTLRFMARDVCAETHHRAR